MNIQSLTVTKSLEEGRKAMQVYADKFVEADIRIRLAMGNITKSVADSQLEQLKGQQSFRELNAKHSQEIIDDLKKFNQ